MGARTVAFGGLVAAALAFASNAGASQLIDRNATAVRLAVTADGRAIVTYRVGGRPKQVIASGAINAIASTQARRQVAFKTKYATGAAVVRTGRAAGAGAGCAPYTGPPLKLVVAACTAPDGSHWALQRWQRALPNWGLKPSRAQSSWELHLSHWAGDLPVLSISLGWAYGGRFHHMMGSLMYAGTPVYGFRSTRKGVPLDTFGRNVYVDTLNSAYGRGWKRENSFLTRRGTGTFCYGFYPHGKRPPGHGEAYRVTVMGPGVTPIVAWEGRAPGALDRERERARGMPPSAAGNDQRLCPK